MMVYSFTWPPPSAGVLVLGLGVLGFPRLLQVIALTGTRATCFSRSSPRALYPRLLVTLRSLLSYKGKYLGAELVQFGRANARNGHQFGGVLRLTLRNRRKGCVGEHDVRGDLEAARPLGAPLAQPAEQFLVQIGRTGLAPTQLGGHHPD